jgi:hypothetical protein
VHELAGDSFESIPIQDSNRTVDAAQDCKQELDYRIGGGIFPEPKL